MDNVPENAKCILTTKDGPICGVIIENEEGKHYQFKKIPYAKPPLGNLRFAPPSAALPWTNLLDCTQDSPPPLSFNVYQKCQGSEDCLYIEVHTPNLKSDKLLPVMFWIGSWQYLYCFDYLFDATLLNKEDVVFVRCGFRLGPMGFLSTNEFDAPGNSGLKDIVMALKWIKSNISSFGGDPNNVTIFGSGSGGAIVHYMIISPMAAGLFHKAIMQSSTTLNRFSLSMNPSQAATLLSQSLGISTSNKLDMVEQLRKKPAEDIMEACIALYLSTDDGKSFDTLFKPCVETEFEGQPTFLSKTPGQILKSGNFNKVPIIIGSNNIEAAISQTFNKNFYDVLEKLNKDVTVIVPPHFSMDESLSKKVGEQVFNFYFGEGNSLNAHSRTQYLQLLSDYNVLYFLNKAIRLHAQNTAEYPIYYYYLNYTGEWDFPDQLMFLNYVEVPFLFGINSPDESECSGSRDSVKTRKRILRLWTNFAKYGNPTPDENDPLLQIKWDPVENENNLNYLSIDSELTKGRNPFNDRMMFWEELHREHSFLRIIVYWFEKGMELAVNKTVDFK